MVIDLTVVCFSHQYPWQWTQYDLCLRAVQGFWEIVHLWSVHWRWSAPTDFMSKFLNIVLPPLLWPSWRGSGNCIDHLHLWVDILNRVSDHCTIDRPSVWEFFIHTCYWGLTTYLESCILTHNTHIDSDHQGYSSFASEESFTIFIAQKCVSLNSKLKNDCKNEESWHRKSFIKHYRIIMTKD